MLLTRRLSQHGFLAILFVLRAIAVAIIWLAVLPWVTVWTWRMYLSMGESTAWYISNMKRPPGNDPGQYYRKISYESSVPPPQTLIGKISSHPIWLALSADIFTGQIIASLIVLTFVAVFLLREWISQNARPGVFEDEELFPDMPPVANDPPPQVQPVPPPAAQNVLNQIAELEQRQQDALRALERLQEVIGVPDVAEDHENPNGEGAQGQGKVEGNESENGIVHHAEVGRKNKRVERAGSDSEGETSEGGRVKRRARSRPTSATDASLSTKAIQALPSKSDPAGPDKSDAVYPFTFQASPSEPNLSSLVTPSHRSRSSTEPLTPSAFGRRPPLPSSIPAFPGQEPLFTLTPNRTPLGSPSLATYRAPEELGIEAGPSKSTEHLEPSVQDVLNQEQRANVKGKSPASFLTPQQVSPISDKTNLEGRPEVVASSQPQTYNAIDGSSEQRDNSPQLFSLGSSQGVSGSERRHRGLVETSDDTAREPVDSDPEAEMSHYFDTGEDDTFVSSAGSGLPRQLDDPEPDTEAQENEPEVEVRREEEDDEDEEGDEDGDELLWNDAHWDGIEVEEVPEVPEQNAEGAAPAPDVNPAQINGRGEQGAEGEGGIPQDLADDLEGGVEDDMEGALEAIGMRGPIYSVFQNAALMIFVLDTAIGLGVWVPFTIGKCVALLSLNPKRIIQILHLPIRLIRIVTDPEVDLVIYIIQRLYQDFFKKHLSPVVMFTTSLVEKTLGEDTLATYLNFANRTYNETVEYFSGISAPLNETAATETIFDKLPLYLGPTEPYFALLGKEVRLGVIKFKDAWYRMAVGSGPAERVFAIGLGYSVVALVLALYLNILTVGNARTASRAVRNAVRQQLLVIKVAAFIFIELVLFPLGCGIVLDLCTVWLFPEANLQSRIAFFAQAPLTAMFYHWIAGTMFMYSFAVLLSGCRAVMRPGAMWFIKDPQDQNSHPIRDILDRPTLTQLRKIFMSAILYSVVVCCAVGSVAGLLVLGNKSILPFRWKNREPLSNVPIDLLFLHLVLPYTMHYFRPKRAIKYFATVVWRNLSTRLRLTSYFFGENRPEEQYTPRRWFSADINDSELSSRRDGTFRRVPATDNLALPRDMRATAQVTESGDPIDKTAEELIKAQNAEALKAKRDIHFDYRVVYIPPGFRYRIFAFILSMWAIGAVILGISVALPITLGRSVFRLFVSRDVHDGYSLILGFYLLVACYLCGRAIDRLDKRRQRRRSPEGPRADLKVLVVKRGLLWLAKISYMVVTLGVLLPILVALVMELYVILPARLALHPTLIPKIRIVDTWALGLLYVKIAFHAHRIQPNSRISRGLHHIVTHGWLRPDPISATKEVIVPVAGGLLGMILLPGALFRAFQYLFPSLVADDKFVFMNIYPGIFVVAGLMQSSRYINDIVSSWSQAIRDKEFLVEMRLRNHEPGAEDEAIEVAE